MKALPEGGKPPLGIAGGIARFFVNSKLTSLVIIAAVLLGAFSVIMLPREEEPQIKVPMIDVLVAMPGASAAEIEERVTAPMEKLLWELPHVEYVYSTSRPGELLIIVRFKVGSDPAESLAALSEKLRSNADSIPPGVTAPLIKARSIDDVPILALTLHSPRYDHLTLRRLASEIDTVVKRVPDVAETRILGGAHRQIRVSVDSARLMSRGLDFVALVPVLQQANRQGRVGVLTESNREILVETGGFLRSADDVAGVVIGVQAGRPIYMSDVADVRDEASDADQYVYFGAGGSLSGAHAEEPAVTLTLAKRPGANAIAVARRVLAQVEALKGSVVPDDVEITITRHYGETANEKSNELLLHMMIAVVSVSLLILIGLGWRESMIVAIAIPATLALTLLVFYLHGFTLNRITLFALIFSIGILVDDAIVVVENIVRHMHIPANRGRPLGDVAIEAVGEVGNPTILATWAVIAAVLPMAFVGGLMGPYMRPIPIGASAAMIFSLAIAFIVTPWAAIRILRSSGGKHSRDPRETHNPGKEDALTRSYRRVMRPLLASRRWRIGFLISIMVLLFIAMGTVGMGWVKVKMLPFDNKSEFQLILNMPEGTPLEQTLRVAQEMAAGIRSEPEVLNYQIYAGTAAPYTFSGLVRHYFLRSGPHRADIQVNLTGKHERHAQSHEIAGRIRPRVAAIAAHYGGRVAVAEVPPGPPVLQTLVTEIYGPTDESRRVLAGRVMDIYQNTEGVVDVDWYMEADQQLARFVVDKEKAALHGITAESVAETLRLAAGGASVDLIHMEGEHEDVALRLEMPRSARSSVDDLMSLYIRSTDTPRLGIPALIPIRDLVSVETNGIEKSIYHKNLLPVTYVIGDVAGSIESPVYAILKMNKELETLNRADLGGSPGPLVIHNSEMPESDREPSIKWDGEWHITLEVFRDLGIAFAAVLVLIYMLMVGWFKSFVTPLVVMAAIPFSLVGILPAHGLMGAFFTATSMIGFMAGAGIVIRNAIILVDFIEQRVAEGMPLEEAVVDAGAVRFRPMLLTAMAVVVGAAVILSDPIFQGLAIALMAGEIASLLISRMAVPILYFMANRNNGRAAVTPKD